MPGMNPIPDAIHRSFHRVLLCLLVCGAAAGTARAEWDRQPGSLAWMQGTNILWRFNFDTNAGKPFFHPLTAAGGEPLTAAQPQDHPWHYGLWFSWKFINGVNYWEQDRATGKAEGATRWATPNIRIQSDGSALIQLTLEYVHPSGRIELTEQRRLAVYAPKSDGTYAIDWVARFKVGTNAVVLDRTPMPSEPKGQPNGGYGGLSLRLAQAPVTVSLWTEREAIKEFVNNRARPDALALGANLGREGKIIGAVAIVSAPSNCSKGSPWYAAVSGEMQYFCSAILAPKPISMNAGETLDLRYRIVVRPQAWVSAELAQQVRSMK
jgi:hypothetical protein